MEILETINNGENGHNGHNTIDPYLITTDKNGTTRLNLVKNEECTICLNELEKDTNKLICGHIFHTTCINIWLNIKSSCPICRQIITPGNLKLNGRKFYNIFIRYKLFCQDESIIIKVFLLKYLFKKTILKYSLIKKVSYNLHFFTIIYKNNIRDTNDKIFIVKLFYNSNETLFHFLKIKYK